MNPAIPMSSNGRRTIVCDRAIPRTIGVELEIANAAFRSSMRSVRSSSSFNALLKIVSKSVKASASYVGSVFTMSFDAPLLLDDVISAKMRLKTACSEAVIVLS